MTPQMKRMMNVNACMPGHGEQLDRMRSRATGIVTKKTAIYSLFLRKRTKKEYLFLPMSAVKEGVKRLRAQRGGSRYFRSCYD